MSLFFVCVGVDGRVNNKGHVKLVRYLTLHCFWINLLQALLPVVSAHVFTSNLYLALLLSVEEGYVVGAH